MKQRLCIGILNLSSEWKCLLDDIGVWYEKVDFKRTLFNDYSLIILNSDPSAAQLKQIEQYLESGGAVLEMKDYHSFTKREYIESDDADTLLNRSSHPAYQHIPYLDLFSKVKLHKETKLFGGLIYFQVWKKGIVGFFGADITSLLSNEKYHRKKFYSPGNIYPDEIVSSVSKHELSDAFAITISELHHRISLPFIQKWTSPQKEPVFCFRIDSDFGDRDSIDKLYKVLESHRVKGTWFLHAKAHEEWLDHFLSFKEQELALHGYEHGTSRSSQKVQSNIKNGLTVLEESAIEPDGFCAPYGIFNKALKKALNHYNFSYSSEFTFKYDGYPVQPDKRKIPLQIPIHPICTGSLVRKNYSESEMAAYFAYVLKTKAGRYEPVIFYHHPLQTGLDVIDHVLDLVNKNALINLTFKEFATFWEKRKSVNFEASMEDGTVRIESSDKSILFKLSNTQNKFELIKGGNHPILQKTPEYEYSNGYLPNSQEVKKMKSFDLRLLKTSLLDWKNRITL